MTEESKPRVVPPDPYSERVQTYFAEHSGKNWQHHLTFLLDTFPQTSGGKLDFLIYGGTAIHLLHPARQDPADIDVVTRNDTIAAEFPLHPHAPVIDVHPIRMWLEAHGLPNTRTLQEFLFQRNMPIEFEGRHIWIIDPLALTFSKQRSPGARANREKDKTDIELLSVDASELQNFYSQIEALK